MKPDPDDLNLTPEEQELEQALSSLTPVDSGLDRDALFGDTPGLDSGKSIAAPAPELPELGKPYPPWLSVGIVVALAATVLLLVQLFSPDPNPNPQVRPPVAVIPGDGSSDTPAVGPPVYIQMTAAMIRPIGATKYEVLGPRHIRLDEGELYVDVKHSSTPLVIDTPHGTAKTQATQSYIQTQVSEPKKTAALSANEIRAAKGNIETHDFEDGRTSLPEGVNSQNAFGRGRGIAASQGLTAESTSEDLLAKVNTQIASKQLSDKDTSGQKTPADSKLSGAEPMFSVRALTAVIIISGMVDLANPLGQVTGGPGEVIAAQKDTVPDKALPKTAIEKLKPVIAKAIKDKAYPEAIKAIGHKITLEGQIQGDKAEEKIARMEKEIKAAPEPMKPVMEAVLAHWYWQFFNQNRWRFVQRTQALGPPGKDILSWDLKTILAEIDKHFTVALKSKDELKKVLIAEYAPLLTKGTFPDSYRPTLYDFIAFEAIRFYSAAEQAGARKQDAYDLTADTPIFSKLEDFLAWKIETKDTDSPKVKTIQLYQDLLNFHVDDKNQDARLDIDLHRLQYGYNTAYGEEKTARYKAALKRFTDACLKHKISARSRYLLAQVIKGEGDLVEAHKLATQSLKAFPNSFGGNLSFNLIQEIERKQSNLQIEKVWNAPWPKINVNYKNLDQVHFRIVSANWTNLVKSAQQQVGRLNQQQRRALLKKEAVKEWSVDLPKTEDYQMRTEEVDPPKDLKPGYYYLISSHKKNFTGNDNTVQCTEFWVSDLNLIVRTRYGITKIEGFVLDANSGEPVANAEVQVWTRPKYNAGFQPGAVVKTNQDGLFSMNGVNRKNSLLHVKSKNHELASTYQFTVYSQNQRRDPFKRTVFFTDRSLYRPGQTIHYKGISYRVNQEADEYDTLSGEAVEVVFHDRNGKEIAKHSRKTNDYGSFTGSFVAPRDRLMGRMTIRVRNAPSGSTSFNVEEYKRPKFEVTMEKPETAPKLNEKVKMTGKAKSYTGAAIDGAKVKWRVVRNVRYPVWWYWRYWWRPSNTSSQEIARGASTTKPDGTFNVSFTAKPDLSVSEKDEPTFIYTIYSDVTDTTGETRSTQQSTRVGYTALSASMTASDWLTAKEPITINVSTTTLDGNPQSADCKLKVHKLIQPEKTARGKLSGGYRHYHYGYGRIMTPPAPDPTQPNSWKLGEVVFEEGFTTDKSGKSARKVKLDAGPYRALLTTQDRFGKEVTALLPITVLDPDSKKFPVKIPNLVSGPKWVLEPGEEFMALWGSGYDKARSYVEIEHRRKVIQSFWTKPGVTQQSVKQKITEAMRGGFTVRVTMIRENRAYLTSRQISVPWTNKKLNIAWEHFVSKLEPGQQEKWTAVVTGPDANKAVAEMVVAMYDQSLDAYKPHNWISSFNVFRHDSSNLSSRYENMTKNLQGIDGYFKSSYRSVNMTYRSFPAELTQQVWHYLYRRGRPGMPMPSAAAPMMQAEMAMDGAAFGAAEGAPMRKLAAKSENQSADRQQGGQDANGQAADGPTGAGPDLSQVTARKNLNETAFFFPHLSSNEKGEVRIEFTMPEALTKWKFLGFAHDAKMRSSLLTGSTVTAKDLMIQPNPPRFLREGDEIEFTVKVSNQSPTVQKGTVRLAFTDALSLKEVNNLLGNDNMDLSFEIPAEQSKSLSWKIKVPDDLGPIVYKAVGSTGRLSDGEEGMLPILSKRVLVTESIPLPIRGPETKDFEFLKLIESKNSKTIKNQSLTVQMVSNPSWYAVMALPYLMEYPHECSEQTFNRLYANALARHIANSDPKIRRVFDVWKLKGGDTLDSPMEKNQDLKAVMLEETPWLRQAQAESTARKNVGILFEENRLNQETARLTKRLADMQVDNGAWPWFPGGRPNEYITLYITTGYGRMRHLGVKIDTAPAVKSLNYLDSWINDRYQHILKHSDKDKNHLSSTIALYLYGRSFFIEDQAVKQQFKPALDYFLGQAKKYWVELGSRQSQAHVSIALKRYGNAETAKLITRSLKERSVSDEELGMFWRDTEFSWFWYRAPIESQAMMIEAFDEVANDQEAVEDCKVWLLKQKQTQDWKTTKATADAVYALLLRGENLLASDALVEVSLAGEKIEPENVEAGTGFYEEKLVRREINSDHGKIKVKKVDKGVAWGSVHWQYLEDMSKITPHEQNPLTLKKALFVKRYTADGPKLVPVKGAIAVGDELVVRIVLKTDRDMEYVHMKDYRGSGTEPVNVLSNYKFQDGLYYYQSTKDTASHFFIDYLPKGTYVFEYSVRVQLKGDYQTGYANIQCMYAPEFNSHSESINLQVK